MTKKTLMIAIAALLTLSVLAGVGYWAYWNFFVRYSPLTITKNQKEIQDLLQSSGYAESDALGPEVWFITYRNCPHCKAYEDSEMPKLKAMGAHIKVIPFAPVDLEGQTKSTPSERTTVAEIWLNRSYELYQAWRMAPEDEWAPKFRAADGDLARTAVVEAGRTFITQLEPLLRANSVEVRYPLVIWRDAKEEIRVCACSEPKMYGYVINELKALAAMPKGSAEDTTRASTEASALMPEVIDAPLAEANQSEAVASASLDPLSYGPDAPEVTSVRP
jgi:hypothetical protein